MKRLEVVPLPNQEALEVTRVTVTQDFLMRGVCKTSVPNQKF
jgi:hypothetical protein